MTENPYLEAKAARAALRLSRTHGIDYATALKMTMGIWTEARSMILRAADGVDWSNLSFSEKSEICRSVITGLLDRKKLSGIVS